MPRASHHDATVPSRRQFLKSSSLACAAGLTGGAPVILLRSAEASPEARRAFTSERPDGRFHSTAGFLHASLKQQRPRLAFDPAMPPTKFSAWRNAVRTKLEELMSFPTGLPQQPEPRRISRQRRDGYVLERWEAYPEPFSVVPFLVLIPDGIGSGSRAAAVMCFPGSTSSKESLAGERELNGQPSTHPHAERNRMALEYVRAGMVAVAVDNPGTCETADPVRPGRAELSWNAVWVGRSYESISVFQKRCILEWLKTRDYVDASRIAVSGHSLGAKPALILGVLDSTVRAVVWNDCIGSWRERAVATNLEQLGEWHYIPGLLAWFDYPDLQAALAPRPLLGTEGANTDVITRLTRAYEIAGAPEHFQIVHFPKYAEPEQRRAEGEPVPEGLTVKEYNDYRNCDGAMHYFKGHLAVPWLREVLA